MKKVALLCASLLIAFGCLVMVGCANDGDSSENQVESITEVDLKNNGLAAYIGTILSVTLDENATTGYTWTYKIDDEGLLTLTDDDSFGAESEDGKTGEGGVRVFSFKGEKPGTTQVTFTLGQNWDGGETSKDDTLVLEVTLGDSGVITKVTEQ